MKIHPWEKEYQEQKLVNMGTEPQEDTKRFIKWLKKDQKINIEDLYVLDAGCGNGRNSFYVASLGANVLGYDISPTAIAQAKNIQNQNQEYKNTIDFFVSSMDEAIHKGDNTFDLVLDVTSSNALSHDERILFLKETFRVLKSGGYMFLKTLCKDGDDNAKYLLKNFGTGEHDMYKLQGTSITERVFTKADLLDYYEPYARILSIDKKFSYTRMNGRVYKRAFWLVYLQKK
jgi:SAM-dependent methyltransferase